MTEFRLLRFAYGVCGFIDKCALQMNAIVNGDGIFIYLKPIRLILWLFLSDEIVLGSVGKKGYRILLSVRRYMRATKAWSG